jgi:hypothetical protein
MERNERERGERKNEGRERKRESLNSNSDKRRETRVFFSFCFSIFFCQKEGRDSYSKVKERASKGRAERDIARATCLWRCRPWRRRKKWRERKKRWLTLNVVYFFRSFFSAGGGDDDRNFVSSATPHPLLFPFPFAFRPAMETSTLSGVRCAQSAARGHVLRRAAARRSSLVSDSSLRSLSPPLLAGQRLLNRQPSRIHPVQAAPSTPPPPGSAGDEADVLKLHEELLAQVGVEGYLNRKRVCRVDASESFTWPRRTKNSDLLLPLPLLSFLLFAYSLFSPFSSSEKSPSPPADRAAQEAPARAHGGPPRGRDLPRWRGRVVRLDGREGARASPLVFGVGSEEEKRRERRARGAASSSTRNSEEGGGGICASFCCAAEAPAGAGAFPSSSVAHRRRCPSRPSRPRGPCGPGGAPRRRQREADESGLCSLGDGPLVEDGRARGRHG